MVIGIFHVKQCIGLTHYLWKFTYCEVIRIRVHIKLTLQVGSFRFIFTSSSFQRKFSVFGFSLHNIEYGDLPNAICET